MGMCSGLTITGRREPNCRTSSRAGSRSRAFDRQPSWTEFVRHYCGEGASPTSRACLSMNALPRSAGRGFFPVSGGLPGSPSRLVPSTTWRFRCGQVNILLALTDIDPVTADPDRGRAATKSNFPHPMDMYVDSDGKAGFHGQSARLRSRWRSNKGDCGAVLRRNVARRVLRSNPGEARAVIYIGTESPGDPLATGYQYSKALLGRLTPARRAILERVKPDVPDPFGSARSSSSFCHSESPLRRVSRRWGMTSFLQHQHQGHKAH